MIFGKGYIVEGLEARQQEAGSRIILEVYFLSVQKGLKEGVKCTIEYYSA